jgi:aryl-alcohol dehydrogenase-like predicted oxidoreductase
MQYQQLGSTGAFVSRLALGGSTFGGADIPVYSVIGGLSQQDADKMVGVALEAGVNLFDTADIYAGGESEMRLGTALGKHRQDVLLSTKLFHRMGPGPNNVGHSRLHMMRALEESLRRLKTDYIDLYQLHLYDPLTGFEEILRTLDDAIRQGKVRYIGCSNLTAWQIMKALGVSQQHGWEKFVCVQAYYSLSGRDIEREILPLCEDQKLGLMTWSALAGGLLTGKFTRHAKPNDGSRRLQLDFPPVNLEQSYNIIDVARDIAQRDGVSVAQVAIAWQLHKPAITSVILGARNIEQLQDNLGATDVKLTPADMAALDEASKLVAEYPEWLQSRPAARLPGEKRQSPIKDDPKQS